MQSSGLFLGDQFFAWMMLAFGGALLVGNVLALVRPPRTADGKVVPRPPKARTITMASIGAVVSVWALASILVAA